MTPAQACTCAWALARLHVAPLPPSIPHQLQQDSLPALHTYRAADVCRLLFFYATQRARPGAAWWTALWCAHTRSLPGCSAQDLVMWLWSCTELSVDPDPAWMDAFWARAAELLPSCTPRHLLLLLASASRRVGLGFQPPRAPWLPAALARLDATLPHLLAGGQSLRVAQVLSGLHPVVPPAQMDGLMTSWYLGSTPHLHRLGPPQLEQLLRAAATVEKVRGGYVDTAWTAEWLSHMGRRLRQMEVRELPAVLTTLIQCRVRPGRQWLTGYLHEVAGRLDAGCLGMDLQGFTDIASALARMDPELRDLWMQNVVVEYT